MHRLLTVMTTGAMVFACRAAFAATLYVATDGKDTNPGTADQPFATLIRARSAVREKVAAGLTEGILVLICGGTHPQTDTLAFGPEDSGGEKYSITYAACPGEKVVLSGGQKITDWRKGSGELWTVELPEVRAGRWSKLSLPRSSGLFERSARDTTGRHQDGR